MKISQLNKIRKYKIGLYIVIQYKNEILQPVIEDNIDKGWPNFVVQSVMSFLS